MKRLLAVCLVLWGVTPLQAKDYSFEEAYARMLAKHEELAAARQEVKAMQSQQKSARGLYFPTVGVQGRFTRIDDPITIDLNGIRSAVQPLYPAGVSLPSFDMMVQDDQFFKAQAYASLPLFTGGKIAAAQDAAAANLSGAQAQEENLSGRLMVELAAKYFGHLLAVKKVEVLEQVLQNARQNAGNGAKMFRAGTISKVEKMAVDVMLSQAKRDYVSAVNDASATQTLLKSLLTETEDVRPLSSLFVVPLDTLPSLEEFQNKARAGNPVLFLLDSKKELASANEKSRRAEFLPSVYLFGSRELHTHDLTILEPDYAYGVGFAWNLFEGGQSYYKTRAAREQTRRVEDLRNRQVQNITAALAYYYEKMKNARETYEALRDELAFTEEFYKAREVGFKAGTATSLEVNMALSQWQKTQLDNLKAQYDFATSLAAILNLSGQAGLFCEYAQGAEK